jgi:hypothetical protein
MKRLQGVFTGGLAHANDLVQTGRASAAEFRLLSGYSLWPKGVLAREVEAGSWWLIAASRDFLLSFVQGAPSLFLEVRWYPLQTESLSAPAPGQLSGFSLISLSPHLQS